MPANTDIALPAGTWTLLTSNDVTALRVQNTSGQRVFIMGTVGAVAPTATSGSLRLPPHAVLAADLTLAQLFPGIAATRAYGMCDQAVSVSVSHA